jgi:hypothetical protein
VVKPTSESKRVKDQYLITVKANPQKGTINYRYKNLSTTPQSGVVHQLWDGIPAAGKIRGRVLKVRPGETRDWTDDDIPTGTLVEITTFHGTGLELVEIFRVTFPM